MGRGGEGRDSQDEVVMATDFIWSYTDEPHASRRKEILAKYPQIRELFGPDPWSFIKVNSNFIANVMTVIMYVHLEGLFWSSNLFRQIITSKVQDEDMATFSPSLTFSDTISAAVLIQLWTATVLRSDGWLKILTVAYFFGSFLNHNLFLAIHELSHNLAFSTPSLNRWLGIFANLPIGVPMSVTFQKYHLEHHRFQGVDGIDMDIPSYTEAHAVKNAITKSIWIVFQLFFYAFRPLFLKPKKPGMWEFINLLIQFSLDFYVVYFWGWKSLAYLILSTFVGGGMHPMAGHFISEHYVFNPEQETYSYYGPLNVMTWSVGYHNEHHDFPRISGSRLHKLKEIAPEYYMNLKSYKSWSQVIYMYIMDRTVGPFSRMKRKVDKKVKKQE